MLPPLGLVFTVGSTVAGFRCTCIESCAGPKTFKACKSRGVFGTLRLFGKKFTRSSVHPLYFLRSLRLGKSILRNYKFFLMGFRHFESFFGQTISRMFLKHCFFFMFRVFESYAYPLGYCLAL